MSAERVPYITPEEYLEYERRAETKSEYLDGQLYAMAGASRIHVMITGNFRELLGAALRPKGCSTYTSDLRVATTAKMFAYPDVAVTCGSEEWVDDQFDTLRNPVVIVEVLSPSTEDFDRGRKFVQYQQIKSLREYLLVSQPEPRVDRYTLGADGSWNLVITTGLDGVVTLPSVGCELRMRDIYQQTRLAEGA